MRWRLTLEEFNPELIYIEGSQNVVVDALSRLDKSKWKLLHKDVLFKTIVRFQQKDKSLIEITKKNPNDHSIKQFHGAGKTYFLL